MRSPTLQDLSRPRVGWALWIAFAAVFCVMLTARPTGRRVSNVYVLASEKWWASDDTLYGEGLMGFLYVPSFALLYTPFTWGPPLLGDLVWRTACLLLFATGLWRLTRLSRGPPDTFSLATFLALGGTWAAAHTGQANLPLAGLFLHATVDLTQERWWRVAALLAVALVLKPISLAMILIVAVLWRPTSWRLVVACAVAIAAAFLHPDPDYVVRMHRDFWEKMVTAGQPGERPYDDLVGLFRTLGWTVPVPWRAPMQAVAAFVTLVLSALAVRRWGPKVGAVPVLGYVATYLMLFNPRTETNSYVALAPVIAFHAATLLLDSRRRREGWFLAVLALLLGCDIYGRPLHDFTKYWLKALAAITFGAYLLLASSRRSTSDSARTL